MMGTRSLRRWYTWPARNRGVRQIIKTLGGGPSTTALKRKALVKRSWYVVAEVRAGVIADERKELSSIQQFRAGILSVVSMAGAVLALLRGSSESGLTQRWYLAVALVLVFASAYLLGWAARGRGIASLPSLGRTRRRLDARVSKRAAQKVVRAAVVRAANEALGQGASASSSSVCAFPRRGSRIVEMDPRELIEMKSHRDLTEFVEENDSCTVGLHGSRGMGKTALMLRLQRRHFSHGVSLRITSPSLRRPEELSRIVLLELAKRLEPARESVPAKWALFLGAVGMAVFLVSGLALSFLSTQPGVPFAQWVSAAVTRDPDVWTLALGLGAVAVVFALGSFLIAGISSVATARGRSGPIAQEIIERYTSEVQASSAAGVGIAALLGVSFSGTRSKRALPARHTDVVHDFDRLVRAYRGSSKKRTVLVLIDELDRLPIDVIEKLLNEIKDIFHMDGVRVVVSISDEALSLFHGRRALPTDVFDSSFDTVFEMKAMSARESVSMVNDRVIAVPMRVTLLCHAISGGRPRELLRACRTFVQATWGSSSRESKGRRDPLGVSVVARSKLTAAATATTSALALEECRRLQRISALGSSERRAADAWVKDAALGVIPRPNRRLRASCPRSARLFVALGLIRRHLEPYVAQPAPSVGPDPLLAAAEALARLVAAVQADEHVWQFALSEALALSPLSERHRSAGEGGPVGR